MLKPESNQRTKFLRFAVMAATLVGLALVLTPFFGSLKPSAKADAVYSQGQFSASELEGLHPGEVRYITTKLGGFYVVAASDEVRENLDRATNLVASPAIWTYDDDLQAYIVWSIAPKKKGPSCAVQHMENRPGADGLEEIGGFFDPCSGAQFDYAGRIAGASYNQNFQNLRKPEFKRVTGDTYQITNLGYLMGREPK